MTAVTAADRVPPSALVTPHQAGVADNVSSNDCRQFALLAGPQAASVSVRRQLGIHHYMAQVGGTSS